MRVGASRYGPSTVRSSDPMFCEDYENMVDVQFHDVFYNKKELQNRLHFMMMRTKYQFKVYKSSSSLLVVHCMDNNCA